MVFPPTAAGAHSIGSRLDLSRASLRGKFTMNHFEALLGLDEYDFEGNNFDSGDFLTHLVSMRQSL